MLAERNSKALLSVTAAMSVQVVPLSVLKYQLPLLVSVAVMAMPLGLLVSVSVMPPVRVETATPTAPLGAAASSRLVMFCTVCERSGASLVPAMVTVSVLVDVPPRPSLMV